MFVSTVVSFLWVISFSFGVIVACKPDPAYADCLTKTTGKRQSRSCKQWQGASLGKAMTQALCQRTHQKQTWSADRPAWITFFAFEQHLACFLDLNH
eukprot:1159738-Pelagomonas_calceolata.AAC.6